MQRDRVADLSYDPSYAEHLVEVFGPRVFGVQITRYGEGREWEARPLRNGQIIVYKVGRSYLFELLHSELVSGHVRFADGADARRAYQQLAGLVVEYRDAGTVYVCPPGQHDDLAISCAIVNWASHHPHRPHWFNRAFAEQIARRARRERPSVSALGWT